MKVKHLIYIFTITCLSLFSCKNDGKAKADSTETQKEAIAVNTQTVSLNISGMTCEIGCAKTIQSKLAKKEGVSSAKVVYADNMATIEFDANKTSTKDLIAFVDGIAGGDLYKASEISEESR